MNGTRFIKIAIILLLPCLFYLSYVSSEFLFYPFVFALILIFLGAIGFLFFPGLGKTFSCLLSLLYFCYVLFGYATARNQAWYSFDKERVVSLQGTLAEDSSLTKSGKQLVRLSMTHCKTKDGFSGDARGTISVLCPFREFVVSGSTLAISGSFSDDGQLFFATWYQVMQVTHLGYLRQSHMRVLENRLHSSLVDGKSRSLSLMLLLGRSSDDAFPLKELGIESGCAYILALSGMHLQFFSSISSFLFLGLLGKRKGKYGSFLLPFLFVLLVGPKPSLVRALGMYGCSLFLPKGNLSFFRGFWITAMVQVFFFPSGLQSFGCLLSYVAFAGLACSSLVSGYCFPLLKTLWSSIFAILFTAPLCLQVIGTWQVSAVILGPLASALVGLDMAFSLLVLVFGSSFAPVVNWCCNALYAVLEMGVRLFPIALSQKHYYGYFVVVLTSLYAIGYAKRALQKKRRRSYELDQKPTLRKGELFNTINSTA